MTTSVRGPAGTDLAGAVHEAVLYADPDELADGLAPRLAGPLAGGRPAVAVVDVVTPGLARVHATHPVLTTDAGPVASTSYRPRARPS